MKRYLTALALVLALTPLQSFAVTESPTPTPTVTASPNPKATPKKKKKTPKKKPGAPSPPAKWPPKGFKVMDNIYWRTPSVETMMNVAANNAALTRAIRACKKFSCGRIQVASITGCLYWEIESKVVTRNLDIPGSFLTMGMLRTLVKTSSEKQVVTAVLRSGVEYSPTVAVVPTAVVCHQDQTTEKIPSNSYISG
uniref:hypothetical protein n=1 Tax=Candidatus Planktophila sp. TaxID=2175601 RepID=UPI00404B238E